MRKLITKIKLVLGLVLGLAIVGANAETLLERLESVPTEEIVYPVIEGTQLQYVQAKEDVQLSTGCKPNLGDRIEIDFQLDQLSQTSCIFCSRQDWTPSEALTLFVFPNGNSSQWRFDYNKTKGSQVANPPAQVGVRYSFALRNGVASIGTDPMNRTAIASNAGVMGGARSELALFYCYKTNPEDTPQNHMRGRIYFCRVYDCISGKLKLALVPCRQGDVVGFYDTVGKKFIAPAVGTLTAGPEGADVPAVMRVGSSPLATGGDAILKVGTDAESAEYVHVFTSKTTFKPGSCDLVGRALVVGGGGGAGCGAKRASTQFASAGGGGGGGVIERGSLGFYAGSTYTMAIGAGGAGAATTAEQGADGGSTMLTGDGLSLVVKGGGGGASGASGAGVPMNLRNGRSAATGGGASGCILTNETGALYGEFGEPGNGSAYGKAGGEAIFGTTFPNQGRAVMGGGGGGAAGAGQKNSRWDTTAGGAGFSTDIFGFNLGLGGGGAGGSVKIGESGLTKISGSDGGGSSWNDPTDPYVKGGAEAGWDGFGGGGAGGWMNNNDSSLAGRKGGSGLVVIRYTKAENLCHHEWDAGETNVVRTCVVDGEVLHTCAKCHETWLEILPAPGHQYGGEGRCEVCGLCKTCQYGAPVRTKEPTCVDEGVLTYTCQVCSNVKEESIPALGHAFEDHYCTRCGSPEVFDAGTNFLAKLVESEYRVPSVINADGADIILRRPDPKVAGAYQYTLVITNDTTFKLYDTLANADLAVLAGGGGGGCRGGGGGAGGLLRETGIEIPLGDYVVDIGAGGAGGKSDSALTPNNKTDTKSGEDTTIQSGAKGWSASGGGGGGYQNANALLMTAAKSGGSGGGGAANYQGTEVCALGVGVPGQGYDGGAAKLVSGGYSTHGGGGGAGAAGGQSGGAGAPVDFAGIGAYLLGGGGGGGRDGYGSGEYYCNNGGAGGGGSGTYGYEPASREGGYAPPAKDGEPGTGGGGGGGGGASNSRFSSGGKGGSGLVVLNYTLTEAELYPVKPPVNFLSCTPTDETVLRFTWLLRGFGKDATSAKIGIDWGRDPANLDQHTVLAESALVREGGEATLSEGLLPGRTYTFRLYAENDRGQRNYAEKVFTVTMPGGKSTWKSSTGAQNKANPFSVDFTATIGYIGENESTVTFRWSVSGGEWQEESLGTFSRTKEPSTYKVTKTFLDYEVIRYEFVVRNAAADISWSDTTEGRVEMSDGKINESYWATKELAVSPAVKKTETMTQSPSKITRTWITYEHAQDPAWGGAYTGKDQFILGLPADGDAEKRPLCVFLHQRGQSADSTLKNCFRWEDNVENAPEDSYCVFFDNGRGWDFGPNKDNAPAFDYWWGAMSNFRGPDSNGIKGYRNEAPTAKRVLDCIEWIVREKNIDRNRIYIAGTSMGAQGALAIGLPHGEVFAAIEANVPATIWYPSARMNFVDDTGVLRNPEDRDATAFADPPPCIDWTGSKDVWSRNHEVLVEAMDRFRYNFSLYWGEFGHVNSFKTARAKNDLIGKFDWKQIRKNEAYPCFSNVTGNDPMPWPWASVNYSRNAYADNDIVQIGAGTTVTYRPGVAMNGQCNAYFRWENVSDTSAALKMKLWITTAEEVQTTREDVPESQTADVTIRRVQGFKLDKGQPCAWSFGGESGVTIADAEGLVTIRLAITHEHQELTLTPQRFADLVVKAFVANAGEREISLVANVKSLGGAANATVACDYRKAGDANWTHRDLGTQGEGPALYTFGDLLPNTDYEFKLTVANGIAEPIVAELAAKTAFHTIEAVAELGAVKENAIEVKVEIGEIGTFATSANVKLVYRSERATEWTTKVCGVQEKGRTTYVIDGLAAGERYLVRAVVDNGVDLPAEFDLGAVLTVTSDGKTLVEPPAIRDLVFTGSAQTVTVPASELWTVDPVSPVTDVGKYTVTLRLTDASNNRWIGSETEAITLGYRVVDAVPGLTLPAGAQWYTENGDVVLVFREGADAEFTLDYDAQADALLVGGGGPGGMSGKTVKVGDSDLPRPGAGGGAGGMLEVPGLQLIAGTTCRFTVGKGGQPGSDHNVANNKGEDTVFVVGDKSYTAFGGGGGGHASTDESQHIAARGVMGGSSGGSIYWADPFNAFANNSIDNDLWQGYYKPGQGNRGGRVGGSGNTSLLWTTAGGGGAGAPCNYIVTANYAEPGGAGRASSITGEEVVYAKGGDGGMVCDAETPAADGADGLGGGGAGANCWGTEGFGLAGRGGDGVVIVRLKGYVFAGCAHTNKRTVRSGEKPTCTAGGYTDEVVCDDCGETLSKRRALDPLGHVYENDHCVNCGEESHFAQIERLYKDHTESRYVFVVAHRGMTSVEKRIPHSSAAALREAIAHGVDIIELDPKATADGVIIVMHDANMVPEIFGKPSGVVGQNATAVWYGQIENYTLKVSDDINEDSGEHVLTFAEALDICKDHCYIQMDCNIYTIGGERNMNAMWDLICAKGMQRQCWFIKSNLDGWSRASNPPADMTFQDSYHWNGVTLNQNSAEWFNDRSALIDPTKWGWQRVMDQGRMAIMTDYPAELIAYLDTLGRHTLEHETDTRTRVAPFIPNDITCIPGKRVTYGAVDDPNGKYVVVKDEGGDRQGEAYVELRLTDPVNTRWTDTTDGNKKMWYHINEIDMSTSDGLPTDFEGADAEYPTTGSANGLSWANAARAYAIGDETVLVFTDPAAASSFTVEAGKNAKGRYLLVGGGGPGGMNGTQGTQRPGAGGGAGGMLEGDALKIESGTYAVKVGAGGTPGTDHNAANNKGEDSTVKGGSIDWQAVGGGGGGHASTAKGQKIAARGVLGGSSGGSIYYSDIYVDTHSIEATDAEWLN